MQRFKQGYGAEGVWDGQVSKRNPLPVDQDTRPLWGVQTGNIVLGTAGVIIDLFNATGSAVILRVTDLYIEPLFIAVTGAATNWDIIRTSSVGTAGTNLPPVAFDTNATVLSGGVTARTKPTGGAATSATLPMSFNTYSEESTSQWIMGLAGPKNYMRRPTILYENQGLKLSQAAAATGTVNISLLFENITTVL